MPRLIFPAVLLSILALTPGCVAVVAGAAAAGTMKYVSNESARTFPATINATWSATLEGLRDVGYPVDASVPFERQGGEFEIQDVKVQVKAGKPGMTRVWVRVGTFDNEKNRTKAQRILDAIAKRLGV